ncbi:MAG: S41 family peptidase [Caloramator sp.]|nr:S41 family peptidase [Caloramator sp.]
MKRKGKLIIMISAFILMIFGFFLLRFINFSVNIKKGELGELTKDQKLEDFNYLYDVIVNNYPYIEVLKRKIGYDFLSKKEELKNMVVSSKDNAEFYKNIDKMLNILQNGHTNIISPLDYDMYKEAYKGLENYAWRKVISNKDVEKKYNKWKEIIKSESFIVPIAFKYVEGNYIAYKSINGNDKFKEYDIPKFSTLLEVNGKEIDKFLLSNIDNFYLSFDFKRNKLKVNVLVLPCKKDEIIKIKLKTLNGKIIDRILKGEKVNWESTKKEKPDKVYDTRIIDKNRIAYLKVWSFSYEYVEKDRDGIYSFLKSIKDYPYLIIDIRGNGGGSENYYKNIISPLINKNIRASFYILFRGGREIKPFLVSRGILTKSVDKLPKNLNYPKEVKNLFWGFIESDKKIAPLNPVGFKEKIFLLVDDYVYSSAETFAALAKASGFATLVGTTTGGDGIGIDPAIAVLPNSGLLVRFPIDMGLNPDGVSNEEYHTQPDIYVEWKYDDFIKAVEYSDKNRDNTINPYDTILNYAIDLCR